MAASDGDQWADHDETMELTLRQSHRANEVDEDDADLLTGKVIRRNNSKVSKLFDHVVPSSLRTGYTNRRAVPSTRRRLRCCNRALIRLFVNLAYTVLAIVISALIVAGVLFPSYTALPPHYEQLREQATSSSEAGSGNPNQQKVFIASSLYDPKGELAGGRWAQSVLQLIHLLGPENSYLSIYENDSGEPGRQALDQLRDATTCNHTLIYEDHLAPEDLPRVTLVGGERRVKRIAYLSEVRNKALQPLETLEQAYDKVLYLNDVYFDPLDVIQLLFSTNQDNYRAACAVDFINAFKFYDTFATRDLGGYRMGLPFFPWFAYGGDSRSHEDVVAGKDAVRVRSCWGGMVAFDGSFFQTGMNRAPPMTAGEISPSNLTAPYRFRAEQDTYWEASECCLIHADIQSPDRDQPGIYLNPFVRVSYDYTSFSWLKFTRRFESLYTPVHFLLDIVMGFPKVNPRQKNEPWTEVEQNVWIPDESLQDGGSVHKVKRLADHATFCGHRALAVMKDHFEGDLGVDNWEAMPVPSGF